MTEQMSLDGILDESPPATPDPVESAIAEAEVPAPVEKPKSLRQEHQAREQKAQDEGRPRDPETGKFVAKSVAKEPEKPAEPEKVVEPEKSAAPQQPPQQEMTAKERAFLAQAMDERKKRQELERQLAAQTTAPPTETKAFWDDPEGALKAFKQEITGVVMNTRLNTAEVIARSKYADFDEKVAVFADILNQTPGLHAQWLASPDPAEFAYKAGKSHIELRQAGDLPNLLAQKEKELRVKIEAEYKAKAEAEEKKRSAIPSSLSNARGVGTVAPVWGGPTPFDSILGRE